MDESQKLEDEEFPQEREESFEEDSDAMTLDDFDSGWIKAPAVGESITFTVKKVTKIVGKNIIGKTRDGKTFKKNLSNVDYGFDVTTSDGQKYGISAWEVYGKMKSIFQKLQTIDGVTLEITHIRDGMKDKDRTKDCYIVAAQTSAGIFQVLDRETRNWVSKPKVEEPSKE